MVEKKSSKAKPSPAVAKELGSRVEPIHTNERVPGHPGYYEKDGLRTYGDDEDHDHEPPVREDANDENARLTCHAS